MSEELLKALMQLFALASDVDDINEESREVVKRYLEIELNQELVDKYIVLYDQYVEDYHHLSARKRGLEVESIDLDGEEVKNICQNINESLVQRQKVVILIRLLEYIFADGSVSDHEFNFLTEVANTFKISKEEYMGCLNFIKSNDSDLPDTDNVLVVSNSSAPSFGLKIKSFHSENIEGIIAVYNIPSVKMLAFRYFGNGDLYLNGQNLNSNRAYIFTQGSSIRSSKVNPIYYSDILSKFMNDGDAKKIVYSVRNIEYKFKSGKIGLQDFTFSEESGKMLAIMGGSGAGKSTLLNILNGNNKPHKGTISVNGIDIFNQKDRIEGVIGYVSQDDLLIEELTVYQNLYYNAKLCFDGFSEEEIETLVVDMLNNLGLGETVDLKVGSPLEKTISGGQRKRLNIALELIREPSVLFLDEPTSGLSSRDSENIMDLLKQLTLKGKLIFVVIHQPSSDIFKMFDKLIILDVGGYPIYYGNPVDSVIYFKKYINHVSSNESECVTCGNVNPEQVFNIIEAKVLDEYGNVTDNRKVSPKEWNEHYIESIGKNVELLKDEKEIPESTFKVPNFMKQFFVFLTRDILSKLTNRQYLAINLLEAPALGFILSYFIKYYRIDETNEIGYIFMENDNLPAYLFMSVIVALFIGLTVSAEEIIRDQKIRKRESFLNLSNGAYLFSKVLIMFALSAVQTITFILVGNTILGVQDMLVDYWIILFSAACFANLLGLNISSAFNSAVTIYILIPFLLIPQLIFSGVIVKFEELNPAISSYTKVPIIGEVMASRWAFEALSVNQFKNNKYEKLFYQYDKLMSIANFRKIYLIPALQAKIGYLENNMHEEANRENVEKHLLVLRNEIRKELKITSDITFESLDFLTYEKVNKTILNEVKDYLNRLRKYYTRMYNYELDQRDQVINNISKATSPQELNQLKLNYSNSSLTSLVTDETELNRIIEIDGELIQQQDPIFKDANGIRGHFYAPRKQIFGNFYDTFWVNIMVIWAMTFTLMVTLYFDFFRKLINIFDR
jgi:ABC transport system ATP-binding/permease protein